MTKMGRIRRLTTRWAKKRTTTSSIYRSGFEDIISSQLFNLGIVNIYEVGRIPYQKNLSHYTPDFVLPNGIVIEAKGFFEPCDRTKHLLIKKQHSSLDIRFVFQRASLRLTRGSKTTYADWCDKHGFDWAEKYIPQEWLEEQPETERLAALKEVLIPRKHA